ncbi:sulfotransferase domain-containing protein [Microcoleus sp. Pol7_A1]|uniref:sulfotransferase domain-containing protein n=1 Tax=Microcoleus sp. Pol7_A1 TaxID=2818893 RepID=UPI002FD21177
MNSDRLEFNHCCVNGLILPPFVTEERLRNLATFQTKPGDVFVVSYPKTGTIWLTQIIKALAKPGLPEGIDVVQIGVDTVPFFELNETKKLEAYPSPRYIYTHLPYSLMPDDRENNLKYIYLARNPKDVAVSYFYFMQALKLYSFEGTWDIFLEYFMNGNLPYGSYYTHLLDWLQKKEQKNLLFLKYEDLHKDFLGNINKIADFLGCALSEEEAQIISQKCSFSYMKANPISNMDSIANQMYKKGSNYSFMRKGTVGDWQNYFSDKQLEEFNQVCDRYMEGTGIDFEFILE